MENKERINNLLNLLNSLDKEQLWVKQYNIAEKNIIDKINELSNKTNN
jgi:hypothetical protein